MTLTLRAAVASDVPRLVQIFVAAWHAGYPGVVPAEVLADIDEATVAGWFAHWRDTAEMATAVAEIDGTAVGFARYGTDLNDPDPAIGYLAALYVDPETAGRGIGRALLTSVIDHFAAAGATAVTLWVFTANTVARNLYTCAGFVADGAELTDPRWRAPQIRMRRSSF